MKKVYPIVMEQGKDVWVVDIPDFGIGTQGKDMADAMEMARDAIGMLGLEIEDRSKVLPEATPLEKIEVHQGQMKTLVDVDFAEYRRKNDLKTVKKNCTIPSWLSYEAEKRNINFSATLQEALKEKLGIR
ncbi:MAG: type II toxin-antitoxin system HicB family antitoxin [Peptostreptococcaceae bacterium]|nr:type II toxin-antitoxin system HicB family antitoxin [Peptostreptococcaceae bacterium]